MPVVFFSYEIEYVFMIITMLNHQNKHHCWTESCFLSIHIQKSVVVVLQTRLGYLDNYIFINIKILILLIFSASLPANTV